MRPQSRSKLSERTNPTRGRKSARGGQRRRRGADRFPTNFPRQGVAFALTMRLPRPRLIAPTVIMVLEPVGVMPKLTPLWRLSNPFRRQDVAVQILAVPGFDPQFDDVVLTEATLFGYGQAEFLGHVLDAARLNVGPVFVDLRVEEVLLVRGRLQPVIVNRDFVDRGERFFAHELVLIIPPTLIEGHKCPIEKVGVVAV